MRWVMTRVLPLPAPARISTGPSVASTASRCCALSAGRSERDGASGTRRAVSATRSRAGLLDGDGLGEVARLVDVAARAHRHVVGEQLQRAAP